MDGRRRGTSPAFRHGRRFSRPGSDLQVCITPSAYVRETARLVTVEGYGLATREYSSGPWYRPVFTQNPTQWPICGP